MKTKLIHNLATAAMMLLATIVATGCNTYSDNPANASKNLTDAEKADLLERAYVYALPLMLMDATYIHMTNVVEPVGQQQAALGQAQVRAQPLKPGRSRAPDTVPTLPVPHWAVKRAMLGAPPSLRAMVAVQELTGMRTGELVSMRPCDVERHGADGRVVMTLPCSALALWVGKSRNKRLIISILS